MQEQAVVALTLEADLQRAVNRLPTAHIYFNRLRLF
jgi:hypothetical protein